jgi:PKD domain
MLNKYRVSWVVMMLIVVSAEAQVKILFDNTKAQTVGNADWIIDADQNNLYFSSATGLPYASGGNSGASNAQRIPTPLQSTITSATLENYWQGGISAWGIDMVQKGYQVETLPYNGQITYGNAANTQDLSKYKVFVIDEPNIKFSTAEKTAIEQFVFNGGGLFMIADHEGSDRNNDGFDSRMIWNDMMKSQGDPFGIYFDSLNFNSNISGSAVTNRPTDSCLHGVMGNVTQMKISGGTSMTLNTSQNSTVTPLIYRSGNSSGNNKVVFARCNYGSGKVAAMSDSSPADDNSGDPNDVLYDGWITDAAGNHEKLIINTTIWLAAGANGLALSLSPKDSVITCAGKPAITITATSTATSYSWSNGASTPAITVNPASTTTYTVTATDGTTTAIASTKVVIGSKPIAAFTGTVSGASVSLTNQSTQGTSYSWDFGDGSAKVTTINATHTYNASNTYTVTLTATNGCGSNIITHSYPVTVTGIDEIIEPRVSVALYEGNTLKVNLPERLHYRTIELYSITGSKVKEVPVTDGQTAYFIPVSDLNAGYYLVRAGSSVARFVKP